MDEAGEPTPADKEDHLISTVWCTANVQITKDWDSGEEFVNLGRWSVGEARFNRQPPANVEEMLDQLVRETREEATKVWQAYFGTPETGKAITSRITF